MNSVTGDMSAAACLMNYEENLKLLFHGTIFGSQLCGMATIVKRSTLDVFLVASVILKHPSGNQKCCFDMPFRRLLKRSNKSLQWRSNTMGCTDFFFKIK